ncbi:DUF2867 domain-containing protein [Sedimentimonas flavescens]|uniref:DUF2867 domain-containing protein n=1 Tax=Sedimentimonas flavescens TaxID=2851012 RepID=UPI0021A866E6|nr:DUF2867 domain-containing protein [Sedimentimonas flavescens]MCT2538981.1 DUF2867 domain-containing protein [Sedimentimonas flavescens]
MVVPFALWRKTDLDCAAALAGFPFHYGDTLSIRLSSEDTRTLAELMAARGTGDLEMHLARLRDFVVRPFGLKPIGSVAMAPFDQRQMVSGHAVFGVDDKHVDFRLIYSLEDGPAGRTLHATSLVQIRHPLGAVYLATILPGHFLIVRRQLRRIARAFLHEPLSQ